MCYGPTIFSKRWRVRVHGMAKMCDDPSIFLNFVLWPNKLSAKCVMTQHFVLRPFTEVIYERSLTKNLFFLQQGRIISVFWLTIVVKIDRLVYERYFWFNVSGNDGGRRLVYELVIIATNFYDNLWIGTWFYWLGVTLGGAGISDDPNWGWKYLSRETWLLVVGAWSFFIQQTKLTWRLEFDNMNWYRFFVRVMAVLHTRHI